MPYDEVMGKFKRGELRSGGSGKKVTDRKQAVAIMLSEQRAAEHGKREYMPSNLKDLAGLTARHGKSGKKGGKK